VIVYLDKGKVSGRALDITGEGALLVATTKEILTLTTGDVIHLRRR
jgi:BirA family biotin operon repressor/biotin-[acetyl-CoA-carboxylase] ligase